MHEIFFFNRKHSIIQNSILSLEEVLNLCAYIKIRESCQGKDAVFYQSLPANFQTLFPKRLFTWNFEVFLLESSLYEVMKRNHWDFPLWVFMFSSANLYFRHAQSKSYQVMNLKSVKITDMKSTLIWMSYHF